MTESNGEDRRDSPAERASLGGKTGGNKTEKKKNQIIRWDCLVGIGKGLSLVE